MYQLDFLPDEPMPRISNRQRTSQGLSPIQTCTTKQAAILLNVSPSTLNRARSLGQAYRSKKNNWVAVPTSRNTWQIIL